MSDIWTVRRLRKGDLELQALPGIGGRLWDVVFNGVRLLFQNPDLTGIPVDISRLDTLPSRSPQFPFPLWGGEKTWIAPDRDWPGGAPYPALDSGPYRLAEMSADHFELESQVCPISGLQVLRRITLEDAQTFSIAHTVTNHGPGRRLAGIWSVMMLRRPAAVSVDFSRAGEPVPVFGDHAPFVRGNGGDRRIDCDGPGEFKIGLNVPSGVVRIAVPVSGSQIAVVCRTAPAQRGDTFAHGHNVEVFNSGDYDYCETEWHSPARCLSPGESLSFRQDFTCSAE